MNRDFEYNISDDFIGDFKNAMPFDICKKYIKWFDECESNGLTRGRDRSDCEVKDKNFGVISDIYNNDISIKHIAQDFLESFWGRCYPKYVDKFEALKNCDQHKIYDIRLQKTDPGEGYHIWHSEIQDKWSSSRLLAFSLFLNTVSEGGETEFLYQKRRFSPEAGRMLIWPAGFTHIHRGNQPLSGSKYILTGWVEF